MIIRHATAQDLNAITQVYMSAFGDEAQSLSTLVQSLCNGHHATTSFAALLDDHIVGHIGLNPCEFEKGTTLTGSILAPLAVHQDHQKSGVGRALIKATLDHLRDQKTDLFFVYGDPAYYDRFGFVPDVGARFLPPYKLEYPFGWQGLALTQQGKDAPSQGIIPAPTLADAALW